MEEDERTTLNNTTKQSTPQPLRKHTPTISQHYQSTPQPLVNYQRTPQQVVINIYMFMNFPTECALVVSECAFGVCFCFSGCAFAVRAAKAHPNP
jgi:hypothetical protein